MTAEAAARPVEVTGLNNKTAMAVYKRAQELDQWPGEDYEGSSVLGGIKAGQEKGWYGEYRWAFGIEDLALAVGYKGPAILGINWYEGMMEPDTKGIVQISGKSLGGHAILCNGFSLRTRMFRLHNSWGPGWGLGGECLVSADDMITLLKRDGEACIPVVRTK